METTTPKFFGSVLKAIACTPNKNFDPVDYENRVILPAREIRKLSEEYSASEPDDVIKQNTLQILLSILEAKQVAPQEIKERIDEIISLHDAERVLSVSQS